MGHVGTSVKRVEDPRFLQGQGSYVANLTLSGMVYLAIKRSPYGHAKIGKIRKKKAKKLDGVVAAWIVDILVVRRDNCAIDQLRHRRIANVPVLTHGFRAGAAVADGELSC